MDNVIHLVCQYWGLILVVFQAWTVGFCKIYRAIAKCTLLCSRRAGSNSRGEVPHGNQQLPAHLVQEMAQRTALRRTSRHVRQNMPLQASNASNTGAAILADRWGKLAHGGSAAQPTPSAAGWWC